MKAFFDVLGKKITGTPQHKDWFNNDTPTSFSPGDTHYLINKEKGITINLNPNGLYVEAVFLYANGVDDSKEYNGIMPLDLHFNMSRKQVQEKLGQPDHTIEKSGVGLMAVTNSADIYIRESNQKVYVQYEEDEQSIRLISLSLTEDANQKSFTFSIYASHCQFYLQDSQSKTDTGEIWTQETSDNMIAATDDLVAISTYRFEQVPVELYYYQYEPAAVFEGLDRVNQCTVEITNEMLIGMPIGEMHKVDLPAGLYHVRIKYLGKHTVQSDWVGDDRYVLELWPATEKTGITRLWPV
jgi:hypothetical protein